MNDILSKQINGALSNAIFNQVKKLGVNIPSPTLQRVVSRVAEQMSVLVTTSVTKQTNFNITNIPQNTIGIKNPVNILTGNLGSTGLTNNLNNILLTQLSGQLTNQMVVLLQKELTGVLPASVLNVISVNNIVNSVIQIITPTINSSITTVLGSVAESIFSRGQSIPKLLPTNTAQYSSGIAGKYLSQAGNFNINNTANQEKLIVTKKGFTDPNANYPTKEYTGISEVNKLAQGEVRGTIVQDKNKTRMTGAKLPGGDSWEQPESPYKGEYPYNKVTQSESGHVIEMDDTPGAERLHIYHKSGTFVEIDVNGSITKRAVGSSYEIIDKNGKIAIAGKADISVSGACNIFVGNDANIEVEGDTNLICHNDITAQAGGKMNLSATEEINIASKIINIQAYDTLNQKANVAYNMHSSNVIHMHSNVAIQVQTINWYSKTSENFYNQAAGFVSFKSVGDFNVDGKNVYLNSNTSKDSKNSYIARNSNIGIISGRKDTVNITLSDPVAPTLADPLALRFEEELTVTGDYAKFRDNIIVSGFVTPEEFDTKPVVVTTDSSTSTQTIIIPASNDLLKVVELPGNYNLTPNFTVEMLSTKAALTKHKIVGEKSLPYGQIMFNLQSVALNILEPAYNIYPSLIVTSGFRPKSVSSKNSLHPQGKCVDIQFQGLSKEDYFDYAIELAKVINYDLMILHYCNYTNSPWIHFTYLGANNRKQVMTFWNNKKYATGLSKLV